MIVEYRFVNKEIVNVEVSEKWGSILKTMEREEETARKNFSRHSYSLDAIEYEGDEFGYCDTYFEMEKEIEQAYL